MEPGNVRRSGFCANFLEASASPTFVESFSLLSGFVKHGRFIMEIPIKMDDLGVKPTIFGNTHMFFDCF